MTISLQVAGLCKTYPGADRPVLRGVDLSLQAGERVAILGPSGSGKSTLLHCVGALERPDSGTIRLHTSATSFAVESLTGDAAAAYRARQVGFVFQDHHLLPQCTALENVLVPLLATHRRVEDTRPAIQLLETLGLHDRLHALPSQLSGGERQRVAIARAFIQNPLLLLCDEPTGNLDEDNEAVVGSLLATLAAERSVMLLIVTHNQAFAARCDRQWQLRAGLLQCMSP